MSYAESRTNRQLLAAVSTRLVLEGANTAGRDPATVAEALDAAARQVADEIAGSNRRELVTTVTRTIVAGAVTVPLPDGSDPNEPRIRRLIEAVLTPAGSRPGPLRISEGREAATDSRRLAAGSWIVCWEGLTLRFQAADGAPTAASLSLRYLAALPAVNPGLPDITPFSLLPPEYTDVIVDVAAARLLPAAADSGQPHPGRLRYENRAAGRMADLRRLLVHKIDTGDHGERRRV